MNAAELEDRFFHFPPETRALIQRYQETRDATLVPDLLHAIVRKYSPPDAQPTAPGDVMNAFGLESLTLMEVILDIQDALGITLTDAELTQLRSLEETAALIGRKVSALQQPNDRA